MGLPGVLLVENTLCPALSRSVGGVSQKGELVIMNWWAKRRGIFWPALGLLAVGLGCAQAGEGPRAQSEPAGQGRAKFTAETTEDYNRRLEQLRRMLEARAPEVRANEYRIGAEDLVEISVFEAPELNRLLRVSASGEISLPLLDAVKAAGLTPRELESVLQELLRRTYMKDPHVGVFVREMQSHAVSVFGAVKKPGVFQIRGTKTVLEMLSMAEGLAEDAGDTVLVMRGASFSGIAQRNPDNPEAQTSDSPAAGRSEGAAAISSPREAPQGRETVEINLKNLLESADSRDNVPVYPGDIVKVTRAGIVYVVGEVKKPGGFVLKSNENISVLQAVALGEGLTRTAAKSHTRIIRTDEQTGARTELAIDLGKILAGKAPDPLLRPKDIVFVPNSTARGAMFRGAEAAVSVISGVIVFRR